MASEKVFREKRQLASHYKVSITTVGNWTAKPGFPGGRRGPWAQTAVDEYLEMTRSPAAAGAKAKPATDGETLNKQKLQAEVIRLLEDAKGKKLKNDLLEGRLIDKAAAVQEFSAVCLLLKERLEAIPAEAAQMLPPEVHDQALQRWEELVRLALRQLASAEFR